MGQGVEHWPSKLEALSSNPSTCPPAKKKLLFLKVDLNSDPVTCFRFKKHRSLYCNVL